MDKNLRNALYNDAKKWVLEAGKNIKEKINEPLQVSTKSNPNDLVTTMDKETEKFFAKKIKEKYPDHFIFGEEGYGDNITSLDGTVWIIDPIDGTMNFVHQKTNFAISLGIYKDGVGEVGLIYDVMLDVLYEAKKGDGAYKNKVKLPHLSESLKLNKSILALNHFWLCENTLVDEKIMQSLVNTVRGTRTMGSAALEMAFVAEGIIDGYLALRLSPWDIAAGVVIVNEVGGVVTDHEGNSQDMLNTNSMVVCNENIQKEILENYFKKGKK